MADVFLSYKKEDFEIADRFVVALRKEGMCVWWDDGLSKTHLARTYGVIE